MLKKPKKWKSENYLSRSIEARSNIGGRHAVMRLGEEHFYIYLDDAEGLRDWLNAFIAWRDDDAAKTKTPRK